MENFHRKKRRNRASNAGEDTLDRGKNCQRVRLDRERADSQNVGEKESGENRRIGGAAGWEKGTRLEMGRRRGQRGRLEEAEWRKHKGKRTEKTDLEAVKSRQEIFWKLKKGMAGVIILGLKIGERGPSGELATRKSRKVKGSAVRSRKRGGSFKRGAGKV